MQIGNWRIAADWGHIAFATVIAGITWWYFQDVTSTSMNRNNIILVYPLSLIILGLSGISIIKSIRIRREPRETGPAKTQQDTLAVAEVEKDGPQTNEQEQSPFDMLRALVLLMLLGGFVFSYSIIGLDVATFIFIVLSLLLLGYRRWWFVLIYALAFTFVVIGGATLLLSYPMHNLIL